MKNVLYLGRFFPRKMCQTIIHDSRGKMTFSNHNFEESIIKGLCLQEGIKLKCISVPGVYSFPKNNRCLYTKAENYIYKGAIIKSVGYLNLPLIKEVTSILSAYGEIKGTLDEYEGDCVSVIVSQPDYALLKSLELARKKTKKRITQTVIVPDIPMMVTALNRTSFLKRAILAKVEKKAMELTSKSDGLVLLTEQMMDFFPRKIPHIVMEGIIDITLVDASELDKKREKKSILYTGSLRRQFGVLNLLRAIELIPDEDIKLWICGAGDAEEEIRNASKRDSRIKFYGLLDTQQARELQKKASVLINPRTSEGDYTKYSFPSKTMEYLLFGGSVIINRLPGIPEEYYNYVFTPKDQSVSSLAECISHVINMEEGIRDEKSSEARRFIIDNKNSVSQTKRILELIETYNSYLNR